MFQKLRTIHLCTGLFSLAFLLMYGISAIQMAHSAWLPAKPVTTSATLSLTPGQNDARMLIRELAEHYQIRGELVSAKAVGSTLRFRIARPGTIYDVEYAVTGQASLRTSTAGFIGMLNRLHHVEGLYHDYAIVNVWAGFAAAISLALFLLGATGLYLWFKNQRLRRIGAGLLTIGVAIAVTLLVSMRLG